MKFTPLILSAFLFCSITHGQSFTSIYNFANVTTSSGTTDPTPPPTATGVTFGSFVANGTPANPNAAGRFSFTAWTTGATNGNDNYNALTGTVDTSENYHVTLTPQSGFFLKIDSIKFSVQRSGTGVRTYAVKSSIDGFNQNLPASISPANTNLSVQAGNIFFWNFDATTTNQNGSKITPGANYDSIISPVSFRFYAWNSESSAGTFSIDNVTFYGSVSPIIILAQFNAGAPPICSNSPVTFNDVSQSFNGAINYWKWTFGDPASGPADTSYTQNPTHTYTNCGTYTVKLVVQNINGNSDSIQHAIIVHCSPSAGFTTSNTSGCDTLCVNFTDNSAGNIAQWAWDFGDFSPIVTTQNASHCYLSTGTFSPSLTVTSVEGCANTHVATGLIVVSQSPTASFTHTTSGLQGNFTGSITGGQPPYTIIFDPGDGSSPQNNIPASHTYPYDNNWLACVTVTDANGCSDTFCDTIHVVTTTTSDNFSLLDYDISVWPKPSSGLVNVSSAFHNIGNVVLFDLLGNVLYSTKSEARIIALDFSFIPKGVYIMNVQTEDGKIINTRIILQ